MKNWGDYFSLVGANAKRFFYLVLLMAMMNMMSHGTQDLFPTFLQRQRHFSTGTTAVISVISMLGAIVGGTAVGFLSDHFGRRDAPCSGLCCILGALPDPALGFLRPRSLVMSIGAFFMQFMVQGAFRSGSGAHQ